MYTALRTLVHLQLSPLINITSLIIPVRQRFLITILANSTSLFYQSIICINFISTQTILLSVMMKSYTPQRRSLTADGVGTTNNYEAT